MKQGCRHPPLYDMMQWSENTLTPRGSLTHQPGTTSRSSPRAGRLSAKAVTGLLRDYKRSVLWTGAHRIAVDDELNNTGTTGRDRRTEKGSALAAVKPTHLEFLMPSPAALEFTFPC